MYRDLRLYFADSQSLPSQKLEGATNDRGRSLQRELFDVLDAVSLFTFADADTSTVQQRLSRLDNNTDGVFAARLGVRPIMLAVASGSLETAQYLCSAASFCGGHKQVVDDSNDGICGIRSSLVWRWGGLTSFQWAALGGHQSMLELIFLNFKAAMTAVVDGGKLPSDAELWWRLISADDVVERQEFAVQLSGASAVHFAAFSGNIHVCSFMLQKLQTFDHFVRAGQDEEAVHGAAMPAWRSTIEVHEDHRWASEAPGSKSRVQQILEQRDSSGRTVRKCACDIHSQTCSKRSYDSDVCCRCCIGRRGTTTQHL